MKKNLLVLIVVVLSSLVFGGCSNYSTLRVETENGVSADLFIRDRPNNRYVLTHEKTVIYPNESMSESEYVEAGRTPLDLFIYRSGEGDYRYWKTPDFRAVYPDKSFSEVKGQTFKTNNLLFPRKVEHIIMPAGKEIAVPVKEFEESSIKVSEVQNEETKMPESKDSSSKQEIVTDSREGNYSNAPLDMKGEKQVSEEKERPKNLKSTLSIQMSPLNFMFDSDVRDTFGTVNSYRGAVGFEIDNRFRIEAGYDSLSFSGQNANLNLSGADIAGTLVSDKQYGGISLFSGKANYSVEYSSYDSKTHKYKTIKASGEGGASGIKVFFGRTLAGHISIESYYFILQVHPEGGNDYDENNLNLNHLGVAFGIRF